MLTHKLAQLHVTLHNERRWVPHSELGGNFIRELSELTVGLMGYGHIGASRLDASPFIRLLPHRLARAILTHLIPSSDLAPHSPRDGPPFPLLRL